MTSISFLEKGQFQIKAWHSNHKEIDRSPTVNSSQIYLSSDGTNKKASFSSKKMKSLASQTISPKKLFRLSRPIVGSHCSIPVLSDDFSCDFKWQWNTPHIERLIKSVRQGLNSKWKNRAFTEEQRRPFLSQITYMINGRPLYPSSDNIWESLPMTPNDILIGQHMQFITPTRDWRHGQSHTE